MKQKAKKMAAVTVNRQRQSVPPITNEKNPEYVVDDFKSVYPFFFGEASEPLIPLEVLEMYIEFAHNCVVIWRYRSAWKVCMSLFVAHFATLYLRVASNPEDGAAGVLKAGQTKGLAASKSVDGVSVSYDFTVATQGLEDWAAWTTTEYGIQFATLAKMYRPRSIYIP